MHTFSFGGIDSSTYGVIVENPPEITGGAVRATTQKVIGSSKVLHFTEGETAMDPITVRLDCALLKATDAKINGLFAWLRGAGDLVIPADPNHIYKAFVKNQIPLERVMRMRSDYRFTVQFECEAMRYRSDGLTDVTLTSGSTITNPGTAPAEPLIRLMASGNVTLMIGTSSLVIDDIDTYVDIDCAAQIVYKGTENWGAKVTRLGEWPTIPAAGCVISWSGTVTAATMTPRWRDY